MAEPKYIELIDRYLIKQGKGDYNPPSYEWVDNTGEIVRCKDCKHLFDGEHNANCCELLMRKVKWLTEITVDMNWYCADGERRTDE